MYKIQKGILPSILRIVGAVLILYSMLIFFKVMVWPIWQGNQSSIFEQMIIFSTTSIPFFVFGFLLISVFPEVRLSQEGLRYRVLLFYGMVRWNEFYNLVEMKNGVILLSVNRKGLFFFNGLLVQRFIGYILRHEYPVILLAPGLEQRERMLEEIMANSPAKNLRKANDPYS